jgi:hypothetical protein
MVLCAFLHSLVVGCVKTTTVQQPKINAESTECCVYEVILATGEIYQFEKPGGRYNTVPHLIIGTLNDGRKFFRNLDDGNIKEIRSSTGQTISRVDLVKNHDQTISEIMVGEYIYTFDQNKGRLIADVNTIHGIIKSGDQIDVPVEDILLAKIKSVDAANAEITAGKTFLYVALKLILIFAPAIFLGY